MSVICAYLVSSANKQVTLTLAVLCFRCLFSDVPASIVNNASRIEVHCLRNIGLFDEDFQCQIDHLAGWVDAERLRTYALRLSYLHIYNNLATKTGEAFFWKKRDDHMENRLKMPVTVCLFYAESISVTKIATTWKLCEVVRKPTQWTKAAVSKLRHNCIVSDEMIFHTQRQDINRNLDIFPSRPVYEFCPLQETNFHLLMREINIPGQKISSLHSTNVCPYAGLGMCGQKWCVTKNTTKQSALVNVVVRICQFHQIQLSLKRFVQISTFHSISISILAVPRRYGPQLLKLKWSVIAHTCYYLKKSCYDIHASPKETFFLLA